ncbi:MAG: 3-oxoacyl-ACP reductase FabG [Marinilabiliales bacterium]|nr:MAG: 3-oxoacyl-ACP reductase FabG [Marinilabiliales bacterium]
MKIALVTGGSRGIGKAICLKLSSMWYHVLVNYKSNHTEAKNTIQQIEEQGGSAELLQFDVANLQEIESVLGNWMENNKDAYIEVLINNAGIRKDTMLMWMKNEEWEDVIHTNLDSFFYITRRLLQDMLVNKYGRIVNVVSLSGLKGLAGQVNYSAAKAAVIGATKALAQEVGKKKVTVNAVAPGFIKTDMTKELPEKELKSMIPVNRFGEAEEVADLVGFLASDKAGYITGEVVSINGGLYT